MKPRFEFWEAVPINITVIRVERHINCGGTQISGAEYLFMVSITTFSVSQTIYNRKEILS
jgi:hypothetical protein